MLKRNPTIRYVTTHSSMGKMILSNVEETTTKRSMLTRHILSKSKLLHLGRNFWKHGGQRLMVFQKVK